MRRLAGRILIYVFSNSIALFAAAYFVPGFDMQTDFLSVLIVAGMLTGLNVFIRPILRFLLSPIVILTFGLAVIALNAFLLNLLDIWSERLTIAGTVPLLYATVIIGVVNMLLGFLTHSFFRRKAE